MCPPNPCCNRISFASCLVVVELDVNPFPLCWPICKLDCYFSCMPMEGSEMSCVESCDCLFLSPNPVESGGFSVWVGPHRPLCCWQLWASWSALSPQRGGGYNQGAPHSAAVLGVGFSLSLCYRKEISLFLRVASVMSKLFNPVFQPCPSPCGSCFQEAGCLFLLVVSTICLSLELGLLCVYPLGELWDQKKIFVPLPALVLGDGKYFFQLLSLNERATSTK